MTPLSSAPITGGEKRAWCEPDDRNHRSGAAPECPSNTERQEAGLASSGDFIPVPAEKFHQFVRRNPAESGEESGERRLQRDVSDQGDQEEQRRKQRQQEIERQLSRQAKTVVL